MIRYCSLLFILVLPVFNYVYSQSGSHSNARSEGMSNSSMVTSTGVDAFGLNPANYDFHLLKNTDKLKNVKGRSLKPVWQISIVSVGGGYGSDTTIDFYNTYLKYLSVNRTTFTDLFTDFVSIIKFRDSILPGKQTQVNYDFELKWLSINLASSKFGAFNISIADKVGLNTNAYSRDQEMPLVFIYHLNANGTYNLTNVQLNQSQATAWWLRKYTFGYAKQFDFKPKSGVRSFSIGAAMGLVNGFGNVITNNSTLSINTYGVRRLPSGYNHVDSLTGTQSFHTESALTDFFRDYNDGAKSHFDFFPKPSGTGYSLDMGMAMQIGDAWKFALSVTDIGQITWNYHTTINNDNNSFVYKNFDLVNTDPTYNQFVNDLEGLNTRDTVTSYTTNMPTKYRAGLSFQPSKKILFELNWIKGDNNMPGNTTQNIVALGTEYFPIPFLPLRTGVSVGGPGDFYVGFGAGLKFNFFTLDIATNGINQIIANKRFSVSFSSKLIL